MSQNLGRKDIPGIILGIIGAIFVIWYLSRDTPTTSQSAEQVKPATASEAITANNPQDMESAEASEIAAAQLHPEDLVEFKYGAIACLNRDDLQAMVMHSLKHETTKASAYMLSKENPDGTCIMLDQNKQYKVISAEYNNQDDPEIGIIEIVGKDVDSAKQGAWALTIGAWKSD